MNQRKLIKLGNSSYAIALPKDWVDKAGLKKGDNVYITPNSNGELIIQSSFNNSNGDREVNINLKDKDLLTIRREITSNYINGYSSIGISGKRNREVNEMIKKTFKELIGMEIIKNETEELVAKDLFNMEELNLSNFLRRIDNNLREMFEGIVEGFKNKKMPKSRLLDINDADNDVNKFHILISRILSIGIDNPSILTKLKIGSVQLIDNWWVSFNLEHMGDKIKSVAKILNREKLNEEEYNYISNLVTKLNSTYSESMELFYSEDFDRERALELTNEGKKLWESFEKLSFSKNSTVAKISMKLKETESYIYQNLKVALNNKG